MKNFENYPLFKKKIFYYSSHRTQLCIVLKYILLLQTKSKANNTKVLFWLKLPPKSAVNLLKKGSKNCFQFVLKIGLEPLYYLVYTPFPKSVPFPYFIKTSYKNIFFVPIFSFIILNGFWNPLWICVLLIIYYQLYKNCNKSQSHAIIQ